MSLAATLDKIRAAAEDHIPAPALELMHRATRELEDSGQLEQMIKAGDKLPALQAAVEAA